MEYYQAERAEEQINKGTEKQRYTVQSITKKEREKKKERMQDVHLT